MIRGVERNLEIVVIYNKYEDILDDLIDSLDIKSLDQPKSPDRSESSDRLRPNNKKTCNMPKFRNSLSTLLKEYRKDVSVMSLELVPKI